MSRKFRSANYEETLNQTIRLGDALPADHLARFVVDIIVQLDLSKIYEQYAPSGGEAIAPEILLGLLFYGYATLLRDCSFSYSKGVPIAQKLEINIPNELIKEMEAYVKVEGITINEFIHWALGEKVGELRERRGVKNLLRVNPNQPLEKFAIDIALPQSGIPKRLLKAEEVVNVLSRPQSLSPCACKLA
ncbi:MAG TPA: hypothetical protein VF326_05700 [Anaerolineaceae bacterium]|jgi:hypothetical protein